MKVLITQLTMYGMDELHWLYKEDESLLKHYPRVGNIYTVQEEAEFGNIKTLVDSEAGDVIINGYIIGKDDYEIVEEAPVLSTNQNGVQNVEWTLQVR